FSCITIPTRCVSRHGHHRDLHSFPTRRSSDLGDSNLAFFTKYKQLGFDINKYPTLSVSISEEEIKTMGVDLLVGHFAAWNYFMTDRKSTRLNSSHVKISYAVFCLKNNNNTCTT